MCYFEIVSSFLWELHGTLLIFTVAGLNFELAIRSRALMP
jgi:hypothetical protein